jgi:hypothetical protein
MRPTCLTLTLLAAALLGCGEQRSAIEVHLRGEKIYACDDAIVSELTPKPGGWAFKCRDASSIYFVYETEDTPAKGTIERVTIMRAKGDENPLTELRSIADEPGVVCPSANADRGADALPTGGRGVKAGSYTLAMASPCGPLEVIVSDR